MKNRIKEIRKVLGKRKSIAVSGGRFVWETTIYDG